VPDPAISVIIACRNARPTIRECLGSLAAQSTSRPYEIVVADSSTDGTDLVIADEFPCVKLLHFHERKWPGDARNAAIAASRGEKLAFIDADCVASPGWLEPLAQALDRHDGTAGGEIAQAAPASLSSWAAYFCEFSHWMPGTAAGPVFEVPTCNMGVRRAVFDQIGCFLEGVYCSDSEFHWRLRASGRTALFVPEARVEHRTEGGWRMLIHHEFFHGRSFGHMRVRRGGLNRRRRWAARLGAAALPFWLPVKTAFRVWARRRYRRPFLMALPLLFLASAAWGAGELAGYWSGEAE